MPTILSQKIKENTDKWYKTSLGYDDSPSGKVIDNVVRGIAQGHFHSSTIDILDTIEKWAGEQRKPPHEIEDWSSPEFGRLVGFNSALTLLQDFIKQTKEEIK